ncbi:fumarylacetoacetate hydrolase family protein [Roseomonas sp. HJA6]|uniref:Fumarylacetoacetate hydrolase family protein n=1 Tax=Roseomonas alba TaxID=2846776 RepID=A0ABS7AI80_9PROT|nr:fumarylacetoacetate hydrolase family protein [Neoroseomonas alba]MBW6401760.1 fumarylacetoacetate hydrolase family protein [Neoroseomonas alba]
MASDAAEAIIEARRSRRILAPLGAIAPKTEQAGYALQKEVALRLGGLPPAGFKIGATTKQMQAYLGLSGPAAGFVSKSGLRATPASARFADFLNPGLECEIGLRLARDIAPGACTHDQAAEAVGEVFAAIEIVERRYDDLVKLTTPTLIADQVFHAGGVLGAPVKAWQGIDLAAVRGRITVDGAVRGEGVGADLLGHPFEALAWLAASGGAAAFGGLKAGQVVFLGSVTPPIWLDGPCSGAVEFDALGRVELALT